MSMFDSLTTRMPNGATNAAPWQTMGAAGTHDPSWSHVYHNDFDTYGAGDWTVTTVGSGTEALNGGDGGTLLITTSTGTTDSVGLQLAKASFLLKSGKATFFKFAGTMSDIVNSNFYAGLVQQGATTLASITDGIFISKPPGAGTLQLNSRVGGIATTLTLPVLDAIIAGTYFELGLFVDYLGNLAAFVNPTTGSNPISSAAAASTQARGRVGALYAAGLGQSPGQTSPLVLTTALLTPAFSYTNVTGVARTLSVDYITVSREHAVIDLLHCYFKITADAVLTQRS